MNSDLAKDHEGHRERLRKRFLTFADQVSEIELLELILTYSIPPLEHHRFRIAPVFHLLS